MYLHVLLFNIIISFLLLRLLFGIQKGREIIFVIIIITIIIIIIIIILYLYITSAYQDMRWYKWRRL